MSATTRAANVPKETDAVTTPDVHRERPLWLVETAERSCSGVRTALSVGVRLPYGGGAEFPLSTRVALDPDGSTRMTQVHCSTPDRLRSLWVCALFFEEICDDLVEAEGWSTPGGGGTLSELDEGVG